MDIFEKDIERYYGNKKESLKQRLFRKQEIKYIYYFRKCQNSSGIANWYFRYKLHKLSIKTKIQIPYTASIGEGFNINHLGPVLINPGSKIGKNFSVSVGVSIGQENRGKRKGCPTIGDNCWIGANAVVVGKINIGNDVMIAPNAFVNFDVPDHSVVIGNPGIIKHKDNATEGYINNI